MGELTGVRALIGLALRRDRLMIPVWLYALLGSSIGTVISYGRLYPTKAARARFARGVADNGSVHAVYGHLYNASSIGGLTAWRLLAVGSALVAVLNVLLVVRHSRAEEEADRSELLRSSVVGRHAPVAAAVVVAAIADLGLAAAVVAGFAIAGVPVAGSVAFAAAWLTVGLCFAAIAALIGQLCETARTANGITLAALSLAYLLRAAGDAAGTRGPRWLSWLSPIGWAQQVRPFAGQRWLVLLLPLALSAVSLTAVWVWQGRRDLGAGIVAQRPGAPNAGVALRGPFGLAWRIQRGAALAWTAGFTVYGAAIGSVANGVGGLVGTGASRTLIATLGGSGGLADAFIATAFGILGLLAAVYAVLAVLRLQTEEIAGRADSILSGPVGRTRWASTHLVIALGAPALQLSAAGLAAGVAYGLHTGHVGRQLPRVLVAAVVQLPAVWILAAIAVALFAALPRGTATAWAALAACVLLGQLGPVLGLPNWALDISPFAFIPKLPAASIAATPLVALTIIAAGLAAAGLAALRRRNMA